MTNSSERAEKAENEKTVKLKKEDSEPPDLLRTPFQMFPFSGNSLPSLFGIGTALSISSVLFFHYHGGSSYAASFVRQRSPFPYPEVRIII